MKKITPTSGDDLYSLAEKHLGDHKLWRYVALVNDIGVFDEIDLTKQIDIPDLAELETLVNAIESKDPSKVLSTVASKAGLKNAEQIAGLFSGSVDVRSAVSAALDLSGLKRSGYGEFNLVSWIL